MKKLAYLGLGAMLLTSCTEIIDIDLADQPETRLVVDGSVLYYENNPDSSYQEITLSKSRSYFDNVLDDNSVSGAVVKVTDLNTNEEILFQESTEEKGLYFTNGLKAQMGHAYQLDVTATLDGELQEFQGQDIIERHAPDIDSIFLKREVRLNGEVSYEINIGFMNDLATKDYFQFEVFFEDTLIKNEHENENFFFSLVDDAIFGDTVSEFTVVDRAINEDEDKPKENPPFMLEVNMKNLNQKAYNYWRKLYVNRVSGTDTPQTEVRGNVNNLTYDDRYALGVFVCSAINSSKQLITEFPSE